MTSRKRKSGTLAEGVIQGLRDALAHESGEDAGVIVHEVKVPRLKVAKVRKKTGLSQDAFARLMGISVGTLRNWEQGRREPEGPARTLIAIIDKRPTIVQETLGRR